MNRAPRLLAGLLLLAGALSAQNQNPAPPPETHRLDFWLGDWDVFNAAGPKGGEKDGDNRIEKVLGGYAILEHWSEPGLTGKSWFYYHPGEKHWKQVWVTDGGNIKEKTEVDDPPAGSVRFRGTAFRSDGHHLVDQTTMTPLPGDRVHQVIEVSRDGGKTWQVSYDAIYVRKPKKN